jgi:hypothetical protein
MDFRLMLQLNLKLMELIIMDILFTITFLPMTRLTILFYLYKLKYNTQK